MNRSVYLRRNIKYCCMQGLYWMIGCVAVGFASYFLTERGYSNSEIGVILSAGYILGLILQPLVAGYADRAVRLTPTSILALVTAFTGLVAAALLAVPAHSTAMSVLYVLFLAAQLVMQPLVNAYAFYIERLETPISFGIARGIGSMTWGLVSAVLGVLTVKLGPQVLLWSVLGYLVLMLVLLYLFHLEGPVPPARARNPEDGASGLNLSILWSRYRSFFFLMLGYAALFFGHSFIDNYPFQIVVNVGGDSSAMGTLIAYTAILEMPAMFLFEKLHDRFGCVKLLRFSAFFYLVKNVLVWLAPSIPTLYLANTFQAISFAIMTPAAIRYADEVMDPRDSNKAQAYLTATITIGNILSSLTGGILIDGVSVSAMLFVGAAASVIGAPLVIFGMKKKKTA